MVAMSPTNMQLQFISLALIGNNTMAGYDANTGPPSYNFSRSIYEDLLNDLNDPIIQKFVKIPEDYDKKIRLARSLQFGTWTNMTGLTGQWLASRDYTNEDIKNYYYENFNAGDMFVCCPIIIQNQDSLLICSNFNKNTFKEMEAMDLGSWASLYDRNKGRLEADFVVFSIIVLLGTAGESSFDYFYVKEVEAIKNE